MLNKLYLLSPIDSIPRRDVPWLVLLLVLSILIALPGITWGLPSGYATRTANADEGVWISAVSNLDPAQGDFDHDDYITGSFLPYTLATAAFFANLVGLVEIGDYDFYVDNVDELSKIYLIGRGISIFFGTLSVLAFYLLLRRLLDDTAPRWVIILGVLLAVLMPGRLVWSHYLSYNLPGLFWVLLGLYALLGIVQYGRNRDYVFAGVVIGIGIATRHQLLGMLPLTALAHFLGPHKSFTYLNLKRLVVSYLAIVVSFLFIQPYTLVNLGQIVNDTQFVAGLHQTSIRQGIPIWFKDLMLVVMPEALSCVSFMIVLVASIWWLNTHRFFRPKELIIAAWVGLLLALSFQLKDPRVGRTLPISFVWLTVAVFFLSVIAQRMKSVALVLSILMVANMAWDDIQLTSFYLRDTAREDASEWIADHIPPGSVIGFLEDREPDHLMPFLIYGDYYQPERSGPLYEYLYISQKDVRALSENGPGAIIIINNRAKIPAWEDWLTPQLDNSYYIASEFKSPDILSSGAWRPKRYMWDLSPTHIRILLRQGNPYGS